MFDSSAHTSLTKHRNIVYLLTQNSTQRSYVGETEQTLASRYCISEDQLKNNCIGYCFIYDKYGKRRKNSAISNKILENDILQSPTTFEAKVLYKDIPNQKERRELENKMMDKYKTLGCNGYNRKYSEIDHKKRIKIPKLKDFESIEGNLIDYSLLEVIEEVQNSCFQKFKEDFSEKIAKDLNRSSNKLPKNKEDFITYLHGVCRKWVL